ncbi:hypothetical protein Taro_028360 [Colocasia esculenta]|uniref:Uncharacterized protein n=1 Tax=Colocasia esculenta TaxID=4460 RepID=A0A843VRL7_COLES|nr:hypothetical protein [Colocasia esculenta]
MYGPKHESAIGQGPEVMENVQGNVAKSLECTKEREKEREKKKKKEREKESHPQLKIGSNLVVEGNIVNVTVELSSFGRPKKEKLEPHLRPLREATAPT